MLSKRWRRLAVAVAALAPALAIAQDRGPPPAVPSAADLDPVAEGSSDEMNDESRDAIQKGLHYLAEEQLKQRSGKWPGTESFGYDVAVTSLAGLAFLGAGEGAGRGHYCARPYNDPVRKAIEYLIANQARAGPYPGLFYSGGEGPLGPEHRPMHGHGFALLFLAEAYGQVSQPELRRKLHEAIELGVELTSKSQSPDGGWHYLPDGRNDEGSVTVTQIQGLRAARNCGIKVRREVIDKAVDYIRRSQEADGGIRYTIRYGHASVSLTAAGMAVLYGAGRYDERQLLDKGFQYIRQNQDAEDRRRFFFYRHLYLAQAMHQRGEPEWSAYYPRARDEILHLRRKDGAWNDELAGRPFATACALLVLELPLRYLPIFQR